MLDQKVYGKGGEKALQEKTVAVHCREVAQYSAAIQGKTREQLVQEKADSLEFSALLL